MRPARSLGRGGAHQAHPHIRLAPTPLVLRAARMLGNKLHQKDLTTDRMRSAIEVLKDAGETVSEKTFMEILDEIDRINAAKSGI